MLNQPFPPVSTFNIVGPSTLIQGHHQKILNPNRGNQTCNNKKKRVYVIQVSVSAADKSHLVGQFFCLMAMKDLFKPTNITAFF